MSKSKYQSVRMMIYKPKYRGIEYGLDSENIYLQKHLRGRRYVCTAKDYNTKSAEFK